MEAHTPDDMPMTAAHFSFNALRPESNFHAIRTARDPKLDFARALMLVLGIPFHVTEMYGITPGWFIDSGHRMVSATAFGAISHSFRMPAFFVLAGYFSAMVLAKRDVREWLGDRIKRVAFPLFTTFALLGFWEATISNVPDQGSLLAAMKAALQQFPRGWLIHRWFLVVLLVYTAAAAIAFGPLRTVVTKALAWPAARRIAPLVLWGVLIGAGTLWHLASLKITGALGSGSAIEYMRKTLIYAPFFLAGCAAFYSPNLQREILQPRFAIVILGILSISVFVYFDTAAQAAGYSGSSGAIALDFGRHLSYISAGFLGSAAVFGIISLIVRRNSPVISYFVAGAMIMYLTHMIFVLGLGLFFRGVDMPPVVEIVLVIVGTLVGVVASFEVIKRSRLLSLIFNGGPVKFPPTALSGNRAATANR